MAFDYQLDLFLPPPSEFDLVSSDIEQVRQRCDNVRRGIFKRHNILAREQVVMRDEIEELRSEIKRLKILLNN